MNNQTKAAFFVHFPQRDAQVKLTNKKRFDVSPTGFIRNVTNNIALATASGLR